jgi:hypothetical protein
LVEFLIPASVEVIADNAFSCSTSLASVEFESGSRLQRIKAHTFADTTLTQILLPNSLRFINGSAFVKLHLTSVSFFPSMTNFNVRQTQIEEIPTRTLIRCFGTTTSIEISNSVQTIGEECFGWHGWLEWVTFEVESQLKVIGALPFAYTSLKVVLRIPRSVTLLSKSCFGDC